MKTVALRRKASILNGGTPTADPANWNGDIPWATPIDLARVNGGTIVETDRSLTRAGVESGSRTAPADSVLLSSRAPIGYTARNLTAMAFNQGCKAVAPSSQLDSRFLQYSLISQTSHLKALGSGSTFLELSSEALAALPIPKLAMVEQRRIADFLDDRVARIDQIIAARQSQIDSIEDDVLANWDELDSRLSSYPLIPLRRVLRSIADGPFGSSLTSSHYTDSGTRVIRLGNIGLATFRSHDAAYVSSEYGAKLSAHAVEPGDLLMAGLGDERWPLGRCTIAPNDLGPAIVKADCYRIRLDPRVDHAFAASYLSGPRSRAALALLARGATRARLNTDLARQAEIPLAPSTGQREYVALLRRNREASHQQQTGLHRGIALLMEYKQSLITAAVTGELDATTAGSGSPG